MTRTLASATLPTSLVFSLAVALGGASATAAPPPRLDNFSPLGVRRGLETEVVFTGANLGSKPRLIAAFPFLAAPSKTASDAGNWRTRIRVADDAAPGIYAVRIQTDDGVSNSLLFSVGQLASVAEVEDNSLFERAQTVPSACVVEGQSAGADVDFFRFAGKKGQRIVIDAQCARIGSGVDPTLRLTTIGRQYVASADDSPGLLTDARLFATLPADGDYVVEISDTRYQGGGRAVYRLVIGPIPVAEEVYPLGGRVGETVGFELRGGTLPGGMTLAAATLKPEPALESTHLKASAGPVGAIADVEGIAPILTGVVNEVRESADASATPSKGVAPVVFNGRIDPASDEDRFTLAVVPGQRFHIEVHAADHGSALDGVLQVLNPAGAQIAFGDDTQVPDRGKRKKGRNAGMVSPDPSLDVAVPAGVNELTLVLRDLEKRGGLGFAYRIEVEPLTPSFELNLVAPEVTIPRGGSALIGVNSTRREYGGPIELTVANPPAGVTVRPGRIVPGQDLGWLSVSAAADAPLTLGDLKVVGTGQGPSGPITATAALDVVYARQGPVPISVQTQQELIGAVALPKALALDSVAAPIELVHGYGTPVAIKKRTLDPKANIAVALEPTQPLMPGITIPNATIADKAPEGAITVNVAVAAPIVPGSLAFRGKFKANNVDDVADVPAVSYVIVRPADIAFAMPKLELKAGSTGAIKAKITRRGPFKDPVTVTLTGLPAGLKADPVVVAAAPFADDFTIKVVADKTAKPADATAQVALKYQVNKADYPAPPTPLPIKILPAQ